MHYSNYAQRPHFIAAFALGTLSLLGCADSTPREDVASTTAAVMYPEGALEKTLAPVRKLQTPGFIYMKSIEETYSIVGNMAHTVYVYQPDGNAEGIRFELTAKTSTGAVDTAQRFTQVSLTAHPGESDETRQALSDAAGSAVYSIATSQAGWYRFNFNYAAVNSGRTLAIKAYDAGGSPLKMAWNDPPGTNVQVRATVQVDQSAAAYLKGGAYRNATAAEYAYVDSVKVDGNLLYRRGFDQGRFAFPLGGLMAGQHTVEFSLNKSGTGAAKFWFGVNDVSFDPLASKTAWAPSQFLYWGSMHTGDYDAWNDGVAFAQGASVVSGVRPPPVRRGTTFALALEHASLGSGNAILRIYPLGSGSETNWPTSLTTDADYRGGIMTAAGFSARYREHWKVSVPTSAAVGRYVVRAFAPNGAQIGTDVVFYVLHDAYSLVAKGALSKAELETFGYDEDEDGVDMQGNFGTDADSWRDNFTAIYPGSMAWGYTQIAKITGAFRRTNNDLGLSMLDYAMASVQGTTTEFESMRRLYRLVSQHLRYTHYDIQDDSSMTFISYGDGNGFSLDDAAKYSKAGTEMPSTVGGQCQDYGTILAALARTSGIVARATSSQAGLGGWADHYFTEAYIPTLPQHGGKTSATGGTASDTDPWYVFDATDPRGSGIDMAWGYHGESVAPRAEYGRAKLVMWGPPYDNIWDVVTTKLGWNPLFDGTVYSADVTSVAKAYSSGPEFWLTASGLTGWLGYGDKDVYRISRTSTAAKAVRVRALPSGGEYFTPVICIAPVGSFPVLPEKCANPASRQNLPAGESYVVVFNDTPDVNYSRILRGDTIQYVVELEY